MTRQALLCAGVLAALAAIHGQDVKITISGGQLPTVAVPDLAGSAGAERFTTLVNQIVWDDLNGAGFFKLAPKTLYPKVEPHDAADFLSVRTLRPRLEEWAAPPLSSNYLAFGRTELRNGALALYGWLYDLKGATPQAAQVLGRRYAGAADQDGARRIAHQFAADIIAAFGGQPVFDTHIYFTSDRSGHKEIWVMDPDGRNQRQITHFNFIAQFPAVSPDGSKIAFTAWPGPDLSPRVFVYSADPVMDLHFRGEEASMTGTPSFTPDGKEIVYMANAGEAHHIFFADLTGAHVRELTVSDSDDAEPKVNPRTGSDMVFSSGRAGAEQIYRANMDGLDVEKLTDGTGSAANPSWNPNGQTIAFAWTRGYEPGHFNVFTMDIASRVYVQLTHNDGRNENPSWAPDGAHIVFGSNRGGSYQIWSMLANGTDLRQLTTLGNNSNPAWGR
ncbi:MAG TPA: hypothetical protein VMU19_04470 [Bryobacteraceae bacterium]|nr:hypothetical protein [Bryobacteraceae bacterium]